jgi:hypothetical protein
MFWIKVGMGGILCGDLIEFICGAVGLYVRWKGGGCYLLSRTNSISYDTWVKN